MPHYPDIRERQENPEHPRDMDVRGETRRRTDDILYASMRRRFLPRAREQMAERQSRETPVTPWQRGRNYEWARMQNGFSYAVYDNGVIKVSPPRSNRPPFQVGIGMCPPAVQQKHMEKMVALRSSSTPPEARETGLSWSTRTQRNSGERYDYLSLPNGMKFAVFHRGPVIKRFTRREGIVNISFASAPAFVQQRAMEIRVSAAASSSRPTEVPAPQMRTRPITGIPETAAPPEVTPTQTRSPEASGGLVIVRENMTAAQALQEISGRTFTAKNGERISLSASSTFNNSFFSRNGIPDVRLEEYVRNMTIAADRLQQYLSSLNAVPSNMNISFDGRAYLLTTPGQKVLATAHYLLREQSGRDRYVTQDGEQVTMGSERGMTSLSFSSRKEFVSPAGSLRMRMTNERTEYYDGEDRSRPTVVMASRQTELRLRDGTYPLRAGIYHVPERGAPIGRFESGRSFRSAIEKARYQMDDRDCERAKRYLDDVVRTLKTPEAITAFVTSNFDFVSRGGVRGGAIRAEAEARGEQYAQHPLRTVFLGSGDCEDFAILLQYMCGRAKQLDFEAGASSFVAKTYETHNAAYYLEEYTAPDGSKAFALCKMHVHGFERQTAGRDGRLFRSHDEALRAIWDQRRSQTGVHAEIASIESQIRNGTISSESVVSYLSTLRQLEREGGGLILMNKDLTDVNDAGVQEGPARFDADFSAFVRRG